MNLPNSLSLFRILLAGVFTLLMTISWDQAPLWALIIFIAASLTDWLDGYLARKLNLITDLGKLLDPLADKILVAAAFVTFTERGLCPGWVTVAILFREFAVTGLRLLLVEKGTVLPADGWGKWKTVTQILYCITTLVFLTFGLDNLSLAINILLYTALCLTMISGVNYVAKGVKVLNP